MQVRLCLTTAERYSCKRSYILTRFGNQNTVVLANQFFTRPTG